MIINDDYFIFSNGKRAYANQGIIGLSPDLQVSEGYDGGFGDNLTTEEKRELADYMIALWTQFKATL